MNNKERPNHDELNGVAMSGSFRIRSSEGGSLLLYMYVSSVSQFKESVNSYGKHKWSL
jgi:hypothetical protein